MACDHELLERWIQIRHKIRRDEDDQQKRLQRKATQNRWSQNSYDGIFINSLAFSDIYLTDPRELKCDVVIERATHLLG